MTNNILIRQAMDAANLRQQTISNNLANINTPNFKVERVVFEDKLKDAVNNQVNLPLTRTNQRHVDPRGTLGPEVLKRTNTSTKENGNNVDIEMEMAEKAANEFYYNSLVRQINGQYNMLNTVINS
ncbi:flagellar basal body rod protein FlgB [Vagococcus silagei]|uniref:Flagellar basal body rod protein FlgB n=1 Tax=Vagococcus silagei TaxID=2508885 RepID=A0A4S3B6X8_9ENTE|nr:flagellar basal body rod protein FlgB [Vagococcus silagei]THB61346.1 flagellar basal body rod protein FlgB [Vagococcus silagei]